jgi:hypothetical protein
LLERRVDKSSTASGMVFLIRRDKALRIGASDIRPLF